MGPFVGTLLVLGLAWAQPLLKAHESLRTNVDQARWLAFFVCFTLCVVPLLLLPSWFPLRLELILGLSLFLQSSGGMTAERVYRSHVEESIRVVTHRSTEPVSVVSTCISEPTKPDVVSSDVAS